MHTYTYLIAAYVFTVCRMALIDYVVSIHEFETACLKNWLCALLIFVPFFFSSYHKKWMLFPPPTTIPACILKKHVVKTTTDKLFY